MLTCPGEITAVSQNEGGCLVTAELSAARQAGGAAARRRGGQRVS